MTTSKETETSLIEGVILDPQHPHVLKDATGALKMNTKLTRKAAIRQITYAVTANITILSSGMGIGFPSIAMHSLTDPSNSVVLSENQASWFGE